MLAARRTPYPWLWSRGLPGAGHLGNLHVHFQGLYMQVLRGTDESLGGLLFWSAPALTRSLRQAEKTSVIWVWPPPNPIPCNSCRDTCSTIVWLSHKPLVLHGCHQGAPEPAAEGHWSLEVTQVSSELQLCGCDGQIMRRS